MFVIAALSSLASTLAASECCPPAASVVSAAVDDHRGHGAHEAPNSEAPADDCSHDDHGASCEQHCLTHSMVEVAALRLPDRAPVVAIGRPVVRPAVVNIAADPPPPRA